MSTQIRQSPPLPAGADASAGDSGRDEASGTVIDPVARDAGAPAGLPERRTSAARLFALGRRPSSSLVLAIAVISIAVLWTLAPWLFTSYDPIDGVPADKLLPRVPSTGSGQTR
jgi:peptide/nickel transport system permease protein